MYALDRLLHCSYKQEIAGCFRDYICWTLPHFRDNAKKTEKPEFKTNCYLIVLNLDIASFLFSYRNGKYMYVAINTYITKMKLFSFFLNKILGVLQNIPVQKLKLPDFSSFAQNWDVQPTIQPRRQ